MRIRHTELFWLCVIIGIYLIFAGYHLRTLPGEWFGDISILHEEVLDILQKLGDWKFNLSSGDAKITGQTQGSAPTIQRLLLIGLLLVMIGYLNINKYFGAYARGLPNHNQPWGYMIAQYLDTLPPATVVKLTDCCWGEWGQPEPKGIYYVLKNQTGRQNITIDFPFVSECSDLEPGKAYALIFRPDNLALIQKFHACFPTARGEMHYDSLRQAAFYPLEGQN